MARANAVRDWLVNAGIEPYRFSAVQGFGEERPKVILCEAKKGDPTVSPVKPDAPMPCVEDRCSREPRLLRPATRELCEAKVWSVNRRSEFHVVKGTETIAKP
jgi:outer membrane protein OmpA-like peptidoglycan-associated protein